jgi:hypothetical protein
MNDGYPNKKNEPLTESEWKQVAQFAMKQYFSERHKEKPWYRENITEENVLSEFQKVSGPPISISALQALWKETDGLEKSFKGMGKPDPDPVGVYLSREKNNPNKGAHENWENTINSLRPVFGDITRAMIGKIAIRALEKVRVLFEDVDVNDMLPEEELVLMERIQTGRIRAAKWYAATLWEYAGKVSRFLRLLKKMKIISRTEHDLVAEDEFQMLCVMAYWKPEEIEEFLLDDIEDDNNLLKTFQNTVSKQVFSRIKREAEDEVEDEVAQA